MNKTTAVICIGAFVLAAHVSANAATTVIKVAAATTTPTVRAVPVGTPANTPTGGLNANNANGGTGWVNPNGNGPQLGNGCNASGNVPKKCKKPSGS